MLALGNFYFNLTKNSNKPTSNNNNNTIENIKQQQHQQLKESYKFYYHVLNEDKENVYAANGLAMVCAAKKEYDSAREIFSRVINFYFFYYKSIHY
jgi:hypothetical protein